MSYAPFRNSSHLLNDPPALRAAIADDGYLFMRGVAPIDQVLAPVAMSFNSATMPGGSIPPAICSMASGAAPGRSPKAIRLT